MNKNINNIMEKVNLVNIRQIIIDFGGAVFLKFSACESIVYNFLAEVKDFCVHNFIVEVKNFYVYYISIIYDIICYFFF